MVVPLAITCPHCAASFKVKSTSVIGKKVKCPKCAEPFVIPKPATATAPRPTKKLSKAKPEEDFFEDDADSSADMFEDEFAGWDDDLSGGPSVKPSPKKKKTPPKKQRAGSSFKLSDYGLSPFITGTSVFMILLDLILFLMQLHVFALLAMVLTILLGIGCLFAGAIGLLIEAAKESGTEFLLCFIVPFYKIYYAISRFEYTKHSLATFVTGIFLLLIPYTLIFGTANNILPNRNRNVAIDPPAINAAPDMNQIPSSNSTPHITPGHPSSNHFQPGFSNHSQPNSPSQPSASATETRQTQLTKFDLSHITPMLMAWPAEGVSGFGVYREKKTASYGSVFDTQNTRGSGAEHPAGGHMKFRVYLPPDIDPASPVPCVLVPPAGSNLLSGMDIDEPEEIPNPEHEPYVRAGFAVVTFSIDGNLWRREQSSNIAFKMAYEAFRKSQAGLENCVHAFLETQAVIPGIDKNNVFIAGHSSAGTLSLLFAEHYPQVKGCLAYAPSVNLEQNFKPYITEFRPLLPDVDQFIKQSSPDTHISSLTCPVFLFHARNDQVTSFAETENFVRQLKAQGTDVEFVASNGSDHYQTMIDEGLPRGIEWIKKIVAKSKPSASDSKMAAATTDKPETPASSPTPSEPAKNMIDLTRHRVTFKVTGFDEFFEQALQSNTTFWKKALEDKIQSGLKEIVTGYVTGTASLDLENLTLSFDYLGELPANLSSQIKEHFLAKAVQLDAQPLSLVEVVNDPNAAIADGNYLTFRIVTVHRLKFNKNAAPKIAEVNLRQNNRYVPDSLKINFENKWVFIKLKGLGDKTPLITDARIAFSNAGIVVSPEQINLTSVDLAMSENSNSSTTNSSTTNSSQPGTTTRPPDTKQKYVIHYGVYGGDDFKDSVQRSLKGFVWVDQTSIQFNPDTKEISFINKSPVDSGALDRALTRNKFYQLNITQEPLPEEKPEPVKPEPKKTEAKTGTE
mgnify:CR=1 FL=1